MADSNNGVADPDPIASTYDVYIKPNVSNSRQVYILQFPNRDPNRPYSASHNAQPLKLRIKPQAGMLELDVPIDAWQNYDKEKGLKWGEAMKKSTKAGQTHGMPGGFGIGGTLPGTGRGRPAAQEAPVDPQRLLDDYEGAIQREQVLTKQTLGGQTAPKEKWAPQYMVGAFYKDQLHLTPVSEMVQMRPQFHHIDAHLEQEKIGRASGQATRATEQRAVHQVAKAANDGEDETTESMAERIASAQGESWRGHRYIDEDSNEAWNAFHEDLFVAAKELEKDDNEMPDVADIKGEQGKGMTDTLKDKVPALLSKSNNAQYLDEISAPTDQAKLSRSKKTRERRRKRDEKGKGKEGDAAMEDDSSSTLSGTDDEEQGVQIVESIPVASSSSRREAKVEKT